MCIHPQMLHHVALTFLPISPVARSLPGSLKRCSTSGPDRARPWRGRIHGSCRTGSSTRIQRVKEKVDIGEVATFSFWFRAV